MSSNTQLSQFYACSPKLLSEVLLICNSSVMAGLLFSSLGLTAATYAIQQLQLFCCLLSLSRYLIGTYAPTHLPT